MYRLADSSDLFISAISIYELYMGATNSDKIKDIEIITSDLTVLPFDDRVAISSAEIFLELKRKNQLIEFRDIFIAATCISNELPIATLNKKHFKRVDGLKMIH